MNFQIFDIRFILTNLSIAWLINVGACNIVLATDLIIDDRTSGNLSSGLGTQWRLVTDQVMGGVSSGDLTVSNYKNKDCLRMRGKVSTKNNGGFVQMALDLTQDEPFDASAYHGVELIVSGNNERYNAHLRTTDLWLPWQSYRFSFEATADWQTIRVPFANLEAYRTTTQFHKNKLKRIGLVGIGRNFQADLCVASVKFYVVN
ncbi:MAG: CIA30 family protein [Nitrosomonas sp.]|uniref:CIA30 family protein n=1 Tax=Nitrosomonas sp. TaxID=42353 RepID=UPI0025E9045F|nr:CIA30 family protein [Nitrosomonas sp.]MBY0473860.1 CIA30 family protein [Nitrosomonas sp.]